ncbi:MAG: APC family permease [Planctomycetes bacterium]|nr:APC family permease [Planctomycetota bacterium]
MQRPALSAFDIGCVVIGGIVGVGIFFTPGRVAAAVDDGTQVVVAWALGGLIAALGALVFARLAQAMPGHGGTFAWIEARLGPFPAFLYGWANWLVIQAGALGVIGIVFAENLDVALHGSMGIADGTKVVLAVAAIAVFTATNALGVRTGSRVQNVLTITKLLAIAALVALAVLAPAAAVPPPGAEPRAAKGWFAALAAAMLPVMFACGGWQQGSFVGGAARNPARDVPLGILGGVAVVVVAYLAVNLSFLDLLGFDGAAKSTTIGADAARAGLRSFGWGDAAARVLAGMVAVSALGIVNTICLAPPFVLHAMSERGLFPRRIGALHPRTGSPVLGVVVQGGQGIALLLGAWLLFGGEATKALDFLLDGIVFVDWIFYGLAALTAWLLPGSRGAAAVALLFLLASAVICLGAVVTKPLPSVAGLVVCALGAVVYALRPRPA